MQICSKSKLQRAECRHQILWLGMYLELIQNLNFRFLIQIKVHSWSLFKNDPQVFFIFLTKIIKEAMR